MMTKSDRWKTYKNIPQRDWLEMAGRDLAVVKRQATRWGLPFGGKTINLPRVVKAFHDFLAENAARLRQEKIQKTESEGMERLRLARAEIQEIRLAELREQFVDRETMHKWLARTAAVMRRAHERLRREYGEEAYLIVSEALDEVAQEVEVFESGSSN